MEPKLRFKEFSGDWEEKKGKKIFINISNKNHNGDLEVLSATQDQGVIPRSCLDIDIKFDTKNLKSYKKIEKGDFIISLRSFQGGLEYSEYEGLVSPAYTVFNFENKNLYNSYFFKYIFKSQNFINRLNTLTYGIRDGKAISFKDFSELNFKFPSLPEQTKIADFLSTVDEKIQNQQDKITHLENIKKGFMQQIFSRKIRFKDANGNEFPEWEEKRLGNICKMFSGGTPTSGKREYYGGDINFIRSGEIHLNNTELTLTQLGLDSSSAKLVEVGDILYALYGATSGEVNISKIKGAINQAILCIRPNIHYCKKYLVEILNFNKINILNTYLQGGKEIYRQKL